MQPRLSTRDWVLYGLIGLLGLLLILVMYQIDRQWTLLSSIQRSVAEQAEDLRRLRSAPPPRLTDPTENGLETVPAAFRRAFDATRKPDYAGGDWSVNAFGNQLKTITPLVSTDAYAAEVQGYVLESLLVRDPDSLEWNGLLAEEWQQSDDGLRIRFRLRDGAAFADGTPLDAHDVVFTYEFIMNPAIRAPRDRAYLEMIASVEATSPREVVFTYKQPYFEALSLAGSMAILSRRFYARYLERPEDFNRSKGLLAGSGPYRLADPEGWTPDRGTIELVRNERYWGPVQPPYERILWKVIQNDSARLTTFRNGDIDAYGARPKEYALLREDPQITARSRAFEYLSPIGGYSYIGWNHYRNDRPTRFADRRVRQAMTYLTDRERLIRDIYLGYAEPAVSPFSPRSPQHDPNLQPRPYDPARAAALLAEAGYLDRDGDGVLEGPDGSPFEFRLSYFQANEDTKRLVLLLKDLYARAGVHLIPSPQEWPVMLEALDKKDFDAITLGWTSGIETDIYQMFHGSQAQTNGDNFIGYRSDALDQLIDQARATVDEARRMPLWREAEAVLYRDQPYTFLVRRKTLTFIDRRVHNLQMTELGLNRGLLPVETFVPRAMQRYGR